MILLPMRKDFINKILNEIKLIIFTYSPKYKHLRDTKRNLMYIPEETEIDYYHNRGIKYLGKKKYGKAIEMFKKEIECCSEDPLGYWSLGEALAGTGDIDLARENYKIALEKAKKSYKMDPKNMDYEIIEDIKKDLESLDASTVQNRR